MFDPTPYQNTDPNWLAENGWTLPSYLAYQHIVHDYIYHREPFSLERFEQILMEYGAMDQIDKVKTGIQNLWKEVQIIIS